MNKIQKITVLTMAVFAAVMFAAPVAMNFGDNLAFAGGHHDDHHDHHHHHHHHDTSSPSSPRTSSPRPHHDTTTTTNQLENTFSV